MNFAVVVRGIVQQGLPSGLLAIRICSKHFHGFFMGRKAPSRLEEMMDLVAHFPWPAGGVLALISCWIFHDFASRMPSVSNGGASGDGGVLVLLGLAQFFVPGLLLVVALVSFIRSRQRNGAAQDVVRSPMSDALAQMSVQDFEKLVAEGFRREGFLVVERAEGRRDGKVDLELFMGRDRYLVQCSRWKDMSVSVATVRDLYGVISNERAVGGFIVTSGKLTDEARRFALGRAIRLVPADSLRRLIKKITASSTGEVTISPVFSRRRYDPVPPACPECGKAMMPRMTKPTGNSAQAGWACTGFPACLGSRESSASS